MELEHALDMLTIVEAKYILVASELEFVRSEVERLRRHQEAQIDCFLMCDEILYAKGIEQQIFGGESGSDSDVSEGFSGDIERVLQLLAG